MVYRTVYQVVFMKKQLLDRKISIFIKKFIIFGITSCISIIICILLIPSVEYSILSWLIHAIVYFTIVCGSNIIMSIIFYKDEFHSIIKAFKRR